MGSSRWSADSINDPLWNKVNRTLPKNRILPEMIGFKEFCEYYDLTKDVSPEIVGSITEYVIGKNLVRKNWTEICDAYDVLVVYFEDDHWLLHKLIYSICLEKMNNSKKFTLPGGRIIKKEKTQIHRDANEKENTRRENYLQSLETVIEYLQEKAENLDPSHADEANPLAASRIKLLYDQLNDLLVAEMRITELGKMMNGNRSRFVYDATDDEYKIVGKAVFDPTTVFLIYVWKCKEKYSGEALTDLDYRKIATIFEFWKFFPENIEHLQEDQLKYLKERLRYYRDKVLRFQPSGWTNENIPSVYMK